VRWCHHCRSFNSGWPVRCRHCAAGLAGRLCPRNHINPTDPHLAFCGDCGQPLSQVFGGRFSMRPYAVAAGVALTSTAVTLVLAVMARNFGAGALVLAATVLVVGWRQAYRLLPPSAQRGAALLAGTFWRTGRALSRIVLRLTKATLRTTLKGRGRRGRGRR
jgi:hypothetical protein